MELHMNNEEWQFVEGAWSEDEQGIVTSPDNIGDENLAFYIGRAYTDFEAEFEFRWDSDWTNAGFLFRARDARHYYMVHFPVVNQQSRAEHFWAMISKVDESGFVEVLNREMIHGVSSTPTLWHEVRLAVAGNEIRVWVDGRPLSVVTDDTYPDPGYVGLGTYESIYGGGPKSSFRNLRIRGEEAHASPWDPSVQPVKNWFVVTTATGTGCGNIVQAPNGDLLVPAAGGLVRSADNGRTWSDPEPLPEGISGLLHRTADGRLDMHNIQSESPFEIVRATSQDNGRTWSEPEVTGEIIFPDEKACANLYLTRLLELGDGSLLLFAYGQTQWDMKTIEGRQYSILPTPGMIGMCLRSRDGGQSWSAPANLDGPPYYDEGIGLMNAKDLRNEISAAQTQDGRIITLSRCEQSPFMWESWSEDGGQTWTPMARGPFPMYGCSNSMISTTSGALIIGGRFPGMAVQLSHDDGMTWQCYRIDTVDWANGAMYEVEPDVVLFIYGARYSPAQMRGMFLRVTPDGLEPARDMLSRQ